VQTVQYQVLVTEKDRQVFPAVLKQQSVAWTNVPKLRTKIAQSISHSTADESQQIAHGTIFRAYQHVSRCNRLLREERAGTDTNYSKNEQYMHNITGVNVVNTIKGMVFSSVSYRLRDAETNENLSGQNVYCLVNVDGIEQKLKCKLLCTSTKHYHTKMYERAELRLLHVKPISRLLILLIIIHTVAVTPLQRNWY
jgi:hypothetical protein